MNGLTDKEMYDLIHRRRRQILYHAIAYYKYDATLVPDHIYDGWARELATLQSENPIISKSMDYMYEHFKHFEGSVTGFDLPLDDVRMNSNVLERLNRDPEPESFL